MYTILGTCGNCGGRVTVPSVWGGTIPPVAQCESCGATAAAYGPVIPMKPIIPVRPIKPVTCTDSTDLDDYGYKRSGN